jgi:hypothetical protein
MLDCPAPDDHEVELNNMLSVKGNEWSLMSGPRERWQNSPQSQSMNHTPTIRWHSEFQEFTDQPGSSAKCAMTREMHESFLNHVFIHSLPHRHSFLVSINDLKCRLIAKTFKRMLLIDMQVRAEQS